MRKTLLLVLLAIFLIGCSSDDKSPLTGGSVADITGTPIIGTTVEATCIDSDNGIIQTTAGKVTGIGADGKDYILYDKCGNTEIVSEYYCEDSKPLSKNIRCATKKGCRAGACRLEKTNFFIQSP